MFIRYHNYTSFKNSKFYHNLSTAPAGCTHTITEIHIINTIILNNKYSETSTHRRCMHHFPTSIIHFFWSQEITHIKNAKLNQMYNSSKCHYLQTSYKWNDFYTYDQSKTKWNIGQNNKNYVTVPVRMYCESALKAASHTQRWSSCLSSCSNVKSDVFHMRAVWSADVVTSKLKRRCQWMSHFAQYLIQQLHNKQWTINNHSVTSQCVPFMFSPLHGHPQGGLKGTQ